MAGRIPDTKVAKEDSQEPKCHIPHLARLGMLRFLAYKSVIVTSLSGWGKDGALGGSAEFGFQRISERLPDLA